MARQERVRNRAVVQGVDVVAQRHIAQRHIADVRHHKAEVDGAAGVCLRPGRCIRVLPGDPAIHGDIFLDINGWVCRDDVVGIVGVLHNDVAVAARGSGCIGMLTHNGRRGAIDAVVALAWLQRVGDVAPAQGVHIIGQCHIAQGHVADIGDDKAEVDSAACGRLRPRRAISILPGGLAIHGDIFLNVNRWLWRYIVVGIIGVTDRRAGRRTVDSGPVGVLTDLRGHRPIHTGVGGGGRQWIGNRAAASQRVDIVAQGDVVQRHAAGVDHHKAEVHVGAGCGLRPWRRIRILPGCLIIYRDVFLDINAGRLIEAGIPLPLSLAGIERDSDGRASALVGVAIARVVAALVAQGEVITCRRREADVVGTSL